jgi:Ca2+-binding RTX toxin-like protein
MTTTIASVGSIAFGFSSSVAGALATAIAPAINNAGTAATTFILSSGQAVTVPAANTAVVVSPTVANTTVVAGGSVETLIAGNGGLTYTAPSASTVTMLVGGVASVAGAGNNAITIGAGSTYNVIVTQGTNVLQVGGTGTVQAGQGSNTIFAATASTDSSDIVSAGTADVINLGAGVATVTESGPGAVINASTVSAGTAVINDVGSSDTVFAGSGAETLTGGQQDLIFTQSSTLIFFSDGGLTTVEGGTGADTIVGTTNSGIVYAGTAGLAFLLAGAGQETLNGSTSTVGLVFQGGSVSGADLLKGGEGNDTMFGGSGSSTMIGGAGFNVYEFDSTLTAGTGSATIVGFKQSGTVQDAVGLFGYGANEVTNALASASISGGNTTITLGDNSTVTFEGATSLNQNDFAGEAVPNPCYATGTRIATPAGEVAVESLAIGDHVLTVAGPPRPVRWIGHRLARCRAGDQPIIISAHAFGPGLPRRDLILSPDHSIFAENGLIPIKHLVNGTSILPRPANSIVYWHIELDDHDIILAEGLPAESYLDTGNRTAFTTVPTASRHPDYNWAVWETLARAPLVVTGPTIDRLRARLTKRRSAA